MPRKRPRLVDYESQTVNTPNPLARSAHRARLSRSVSTVVAHAPSGGAVVDFGAGTGLFLRMLEARRPDLELTAVEPHMEMAGFSRNLSSLGLVREASQDVVTAFEVCEHLTDDELVRFLMDARRVLKQDGWLIVSVPIMHGLAAIPKEANRMLLFRRRPELTVKELLASLLGRRVSRPTDRSLTHKGFCHRDFLVVLSAEYRVVQQLHSPLPRLPWWLNSQVFLICAKPFPTGNRPHESELH